MPSRTQKNQVQALGSFTAQRARARLLLIAGCYVDRFGVEEEIVDAIGAGVALRLEGFVQEFRWCWFVTFTAEDDLPVSNGVKHFVSPPFIRYL